jgi:hypothetical protein
MDNHTTKELQSMESKQHSIIDIHWELNITKGPLWWHKLSELLLCDIIDKYWNMRL